MEKLMDLNKETANRLWVQQFGKKQKAIDFAGREIAKAAYNDRNSDFGWNVDHILPQSRGGKTADHNLICCHILTNDEKADRFPCFVTNGIEFEIQKRQNHYEIISRAQFEGNDEAINFLDSAQGLAFWKRCNTCTDDIWVGYVKIKVTLPNKSFQLLETYEKFLVELFDNRNIYCEELSPHRLESLKFNRTFTYDINTFIFTVVDHQVEQRNFVQNLLDDCITLNTYNKYFTQKNYFENLQIVCGMKCYENTVEMSSHIEKDIINKDVFFIDSLAIDKLVKINTCADKEISTVHESHGFYPYDFIYTTLDKNLSKLI